MRREEFMAQLASLLQDVSAEERMEAMQYYNDYFDDADEDQEEHIVEQLGSPAKVAAEVKAGLHSQDEAAAEYRDTGYTDTRFEYRETPAEMKNDEYSYEGSYKETAVNDEKKPWTNKPLKILLIILVVLAALPIIGPIVVGIFAAILGIAIAIMAVFFALVVAAAAIAIAGFGTLVAGGATLFVNIPAGLLVTGTGLILMVFGVIATVAAIRLCVVVAPGIVRGIAFLGRKIFRREKAVE